MQVYHLSYKTKLALDGWLKKYVVKGKVKKGNLIVFFHLEMRGFKQKYQPGGVFFYRFCFFGTVFE